MSALLLHLSDIHLKGPSDPVVQHPEEIARCVYSSLPDASALFIVISGDIAFSGKPDQYLVATGWINRIKQEVLREKDIPIHVIVAPGNHDCDFDLDNGMRQMAIKCLATDTSVTPDASVIDQCTAVQNGFFAFRDTLHPTKCTTETRLWDTVEFDVEESKIVFDSLNVSWVSRLHEEQGGLVFPHERYATKASEHPDVRIIVMHHPMNWFAQSMYRPFRQFLRSLANIIMTGHEHQGNVGENIDTESSASVYIEGDVLQDSDKGIEKSAFSLVVLDLAEGQYKSTRYLWSGKEYEVSEEGSWADFRVLPSKQTNEFQICATFREELDDPGATFSRTGRPNLSLADIYIYPDLLEVGIDQRAGNLISSSVLRDPGRTIEGCLLEGEEKAGCTSLLYRLYDEYHDRGFVPVYIKGSAIRSATSKNIERAIHRAISEQYCEEAIEKFDRLTGSQKVLLLDDFDDGPVISSQGRADVLSALRARFGHMIVTVGPLFEMREILKVTESEELSRLTRYQLQPFGYGLRGKLVRRWVSLSDDGTLSDGALIEKWDQAEKAMDAIMGRNIIPAMPLYLLTLLQSIEAGRGGEFKDSALGHYYEFLLMEGLLSANTQRDKLAEHFDYCTELAWYYHEKGHRELQLVELREFNEAFCKRWHTVDFESRMARLIKAKVLIGRGDYYSFRYPYIYYFLKGRYLSRNLNVSGIRQYIEKCCAHLYVREHANTILFLAHHTNDPFVMESILAVLRQLFAQNKPVTFAGDSQRIASLIGQVEKLAYKETPPEEYRQEVNEFRDQHDNGDGLAEKEEVGEALSLIAQLITLFKTVEILGQVLRNQYSRIERQRKTEILRDLFSGPLRALTGFYDFLESTPGQFIGEVEVLLKHHHKTLDDASRKHLAKLLAGRLIEITSLGLVGKAAMSVSADSLREEIRAAVLTENSIAFRLIEVGVILESATPIPRELLEKIKDDIGNEFLAFRILQLMVMRHMYMFKTTEGDKQWLLSKLGIEIRAQHVIDFKTRKSKRLKQLN